METTINQTDVFGNAIPTDMHELVQIYAEKKGISLSAAWATLRNRIVPKSEVLDIISAQNQTNNRGQGNQQPSRISELLATKETTSLEKLKLELEYKRLEMQEKADAREQRNIALKEAQLAQERTLAELKLSQEKEIQMRKLELEESRQRSERERAQAKDDFNNTLLLMQQGKNPDEALDMIHSQEKFYERFIDQKDRHASELRQLEQTINSRFDKFVKENQSKPSPTVIDSLKQFREQQANIMEVGLDALKASGYPISEINKARENLRNKETEQDGLLNTLAGMAKPFLSKLITPPDTSVPSGLPPSQGYTPSQGYPPPQQQYTPYPQQPSQQPQQPAYTQQEQERMRLEAAKLAEKQLEAEKANLLAQLDAEKKRLDRRTNLLNRAKDLGILVHETASNEEIFDIIEKTEALLERQRLIINAPIPVSPDPAPDPIPDNTPPPQTYPEQEPDHIIDPWMGPEVSEATQDFINEPIQPVLTPPDAYVPIAPVLDEPILDIIEPTPTEVSELVLETEPEPEPEPVIHHILTKKEQRKLRRTRRTSTPRKSPRKPPHTPAPATTQPPAVQPTPEPEQEPNPTPRTDVF